MGCGLLQSMIPDAVICHVALLTNKAEWDQRPVWDGDSRGPKEDMTEVPVLPMNSMQPSLNYFGHLL